MLKGSSLWLPQSVPRRRPLSHTSASAYSSVRHRVPYRWPIPGRETDKIDGIVKRLPELTEVLILRLRHTNAIDSTGLQAIEELADAAHQANRHLLLCGARSRPARLMHQAKFERHAGSRNICDHIEDALLRAEELHGPVSAANFDQPLTSNLQENNVRSSASH